MPPRLSTPPAPGRAAESRRPQKTNAVTANWISGAAYDGATVPLFGRLSDLIVVNQPGAKASFGEMQVFESAVFTARRPVLMVPEAAHGLGRRAAIAWNGSVEACGAVEGAIDLLMDLDGVDIIQVGEIKSGNASAESLADYLGWHGIAATVHPPSAAGDDVAKAVIAEAKKCGATFLVMGAYGHSPLREFILGGVTKQMLEKAALPVLMAH